MHNGETTKMFEKASCSFSKIAQNGAYLTDRIYVCLNTYASRFRTRILGSRKNLIHEACSFSVPIVFNVAQTISKSLKGNLQESFQRFHCTRITTAAEENIGETGFLVAYSLIDSVFDIPIAGVSSVVDKQQVAGDSMQNRSVDCMQ